MIREALILAGGLGTRLREAVPGLPKCLAPVGSQPFLHYLIHHLKKAGISHFVFCLGYKHRDILEYLEQKHTGLHISVSIEDKPLGTGGAIVKAAGLCKDPDVLVVNADTLFEADIQQLYEFHHTNRAACTLSLKPLYDSDRYGIVETDSAGNLQAFKPRSYCKVGLINGGVYVLNLPGFLSLDFPTGFSFEKHYLSAYVGKLKLMGLVQDAYFIDIGIPEDLQKANTELARQS